MAEENNFRTLLVLKYNNYFNRTIKINTGLTLEQWKEIGGDTLYRVKSNIDFNPNDGVNTSLVLDWTDEILVGEERQKIETPFKPDYIAVFDKNGNYISGWFIKNSNRTLFGQYKLELRADIIVDHREKILGSTAYIEKGIIKDANNPLIYNKENFNCNQIKVAEYLIHDKSKCPWLVIYLKKGVLNPSSSQELVITNTNSGTPALAINTTITSWSYYQYSQFGADEFIVSRGEIFMNTWYKNIQEVSQYDVRSGFTRIKNNGTAEFYNRLTSSTLDALNKNARDVVTPNLLAEYENEGLDTLMESAIHAFGVKTPTEYDTLYNLQGLIKDTTGKYYEIKLARVDGSNTLEGFVNSSTHAALFTKMNALWNAAVNDTQTANNSSFTVNCTKIERYKIIITERPDLNCKATLGEIKKTTKSSLFDILAIPYGNVEMEETEDPEHPAPMFNAQLSKMVMDQLIHELGGDVAVLDYQIVPYCPLSEYCKTYTTLLTDRGLYLDISNPDLFFDFKEDSATIARVYLVEEPSFTFNTEVPNIRNPIVYDLVDHDAGIYERKLTNDTMMCRICSPNYCGVYEFNPARNDNFGETITINVDVTLKPFTPYIHLNPIFGGLYGSDFNDIRGLICGGDFSLGIVNDPWISYQYTNKNYQKMFDRDIESLDLRQQIQHFEAGVGAITGVVGATAGGAVTGAKFGGGYGAIAGAAVGLAAGTVGGVIDMQNLGAIQKDQRDLAIDKFNMALGNIKALPMSITKADALTFNNKLVPFLEFYDCTETEKIAYINKLLYEGMTIGVIDKIENYTDIGYNRFVKAQLIRNTDISDDTHVINEISLELEKGVYL